MLFRKIILSMLVLLMASFVVTNANIIAQEEEVEEATIKGTIVAIEWDDDDNVSAVAISVVVEPESDMDEAYVQEYIVANNTRGQELLSLVGEDVEATGTLESDEDGYITITLSSYKIIE